MKKLIFLIAISLAIALALVMPHHRTSAQRNNPGNNAADRLARAKSISFNYLSQRLGELGIADINDLKTKRVFEDEHLKKHTHVQQTFRGVPVFGGEAIVHLNLDETIFAFTDDLVKSVFVNTRPTVTQDNAIKTAFNYYGCADCLTAPPVADLWVLRHEGNDYLTYRVQLRREDGTENTSMPVYFIDAHTGGVVWVYDDLQTATGVSLYSGSVTINTYYRSSNATYYMEDISRKIGTFDNRNTNGLTYRFTDGNNYWDSSSQRAGVDAHYGAAKFWDYYYNAHGRRGIDGNGGPGYYTSADGVTRLISSRVHYGTNYNNAFWNGSYMTYGDGDGSLFSPLVTLDICGHEMQHGVTERTAGLTYSGESGALNESWSDVFGALTERYANGQSGDTWKIGEKAYTPGTAGDALRHMDNPHLGRNRGYTADDDPDHYSER